MSPPTDAPIVPEPHPADPEITPEVIASHLTDEEYRRAVAILGRAPTWTELGIFSVMWSEHCSYKSSRVHLKKLPSEGPRVLQGPGENAGVVDVGDGLAVAFKMESHNHPSYIEPYQGAATGVGGILRDVFTMGARPIASLNSLRFGRPEHPKTPHLVSGVVAGIGGYGNCMGVPTVGGEIAFDASYDGNCLVNAFTLGILPADRIFRGYATGVGNPVLYVGAKTGRDGIHGATMASDVFDEESESKRPTVQVGDPFTEKRLLEACLELMATDVLVGIQDMGAAGLTSSSFEMAGRAGTGIELDLDRVPRRETGMTPYELMLSESQERMLMVLHEGTEETAKRIFEKWELDAVVVGRVTESGMVTLRDQGRLVAAMPVAPLADDAPKYDRPRERPTWLDDLHAFDPATLPAEGDLSAILLKLVAAPTVASKRWVFEQYDHMVRLGGTVRPGEGDAAVVRIPGTEKAVALSVDCNGRFVYLDPHLGAAHAVAESARNVSCVGAEPLAVTDCLNFGSPEDPEIMWQFARAVEGIAEGCREMKTPVVSGNVSLYNQTDETAVLPTPTIGMVGLIEDVSHHAVSHLRGEGRKVVLIGETRGELGGSEYLVTVHDKLAGRPPRLDFDRERAVQAAIRRMVREGLVETAHDTSEGGLAVALAELCVTTRRPTDPAVGLRVTLPPYPDDVVDTRPEAQLFGEDTSRILLACPPDRVDAVLAIAAECGAPAFVLGESGGDRIVIRGAEGETLVDVGVEDVRDGYENGLTRALGLGVSARPAA
jgi:phosphoribosylformylglycinamidine synthase subunit PurL